MEVRSGAGEGDALCLTPTSKIPANGVTERRQADAPIGVFDSGVGALTVLAALLRALPSEDFVYLGDTARLPYGTKSADSIRRYALQAAGLLHDSGVKCPVVACNTASATALDALAHEFAPVPVLGVLEPGAVAVCRAPRTGHIVVIATEGTVRGGAYEAAIRYERRTGVVTSRACPLFVALAEEGWIEGPVVDGVVHRYLDGLFNAARGAATPDTLLLEDAGLRRAARTDGSLRLLATDGAERFARVGATFLGRTLAARDIEIVDLER
jgi:glutamate racemase